MCIIYHAYHKLTYLTAPIILAYEVQEDKGPYRSVLSISLLIFFLFIQEDMQGNLRLVSVLYTTRLK
jgi:hypothetical protein